MIQGSSERAQPRADDDPGLANLLRALPTDARDRIRVVNALSVSARIRGTQSFRVEIEGALVSFEIDLPEDDDRLHQALLRYFGDVRCLEIGGRPTLQGKFFRDGRRDAGDTVVGPHEAWPRSTLPLAVDFDRADTCSGERWESLWEQAANARRDGRVVYFVNLPSHLRLLADSRGELALAVLRRDFVGPRLPDVLARALRG